MTPSDFLDLGSRAAVDQALSRLVRRDVLRRARRGVYIYSRKSALLGDIAPDPQAVAEALARRSGERLMLAGAQAANMLGLSDHIPAKIVYLNGPSRTFQIRNLPVSLRRSAPRRMALAGRVSGTVAEALRFLRREQVDDRVIDRLRARLSERDRNQLVKDIGYVPAWIGEVFRRVATDAAADPDEDGAGAKAAGGARMTTLDDNGGTM